MSRAARRTKAGIQTAVLIVAVLVSVVALNIAADGRLPRFDVTSTGEHRLAPRTLRMLERLDGEYRIVLAADRRRLDANAFRQVTDVLDSLTHAGAPVRTTTIDTSGAAGLEQYAELLESLVDRERAEIERQAQQIVDAADVLDMIAAFADGTLSERLIAARDAFDPAVDQQSRLYLQQRAAEARAAATNLIRVADAARTVAQEPAEALGVPRVDAARDALLPTLESVTNQLTALADELRAFGTAEGLPPGAVDALGPLVAGIESGRDEAALAHDTLARVRRPDVLRIADVLDAGDAAIVVGAGDAGLTAVDLGMLFPSEIELQAMGLGVGDVRRRAEELFASAIGALAVPNKPIVVLLHGEAAPILDAAPVFSYIRARLASRGVDMAEWPVVVRPDPPDLSRLDPEAVRPVVYLTFGPDSSASNPQMPELNGPERVNRYARALRSLVDSGERIIVSINMSVLPGYGTGDPAVDMLDRFGLSVDSARPIVFETLGGRGRIVETDSTLVAEESDHPIARGLSGLRIKLPWAIPIRVDSDASVIASIDAAQGVWAESEWLGYWRVPREQRALVPNPPKLDASRDDESGPWPVIVAAERTDPAFDAPQRIVVVGSNSWAVDPVTAESTLIQGVARPSNPGNAELLEAAVYWLVGLDDLIARSVDAQTVPTIRPMSRAQRSGLAWLVIAGIPGFVLLTGLVWRLVRG